MDPSWERFAVRGSFQLIPLDAEGWFLRGSLGLWKRWGKNTFRWDLPCANSESLEWIQTKVFRISSQLLCELFLILKWENMNFCKIRVSFFLPNYLRFFMAFIIQASSLLLAMMHVAQIPWPETQWFETVICGDRKLWWICKGHICTNVEGNLGYVGAIDYMQFEWDITFQYTNYHGNPRETFIFTGYKPIYWGFKISFIFHGHLGSSRV